MFSNGFERPHYIYRTSYSVRPSKHSAIFAHVTSVHYIMSLRRRAPTSLRTEPLRLGAAFEHHDVLSPHSLNSVDPLNPSRSSRNKKAPTDHSKLILCLGFFLIVAPWIHHSSLQWRLSSLGSEVTDLQMGRKKLISDLKRATDSLRKTKEEIKTTETENSGLVADLSAHGDNADVESNVYVESEELEEKFIKRIEQLERAIQKRSARSVLNKYGTGPFYIKVTLTDDAGSGKGNAFVIETAPLNLMPHAIDHFLQMVEHKLWDGLNMVHRYIGSNVIHSSPQVTETGKSDEKRFQKAKLTQMSFSEHSGLYPMETYSVAFEGRQGRPGGPGFYINMESPFTTREVDTNESCFGKVVEGRGVLDHLMKQRGQNNNLSIIGIESVTLLPIPTKHLN